MMSEWYDDSPMFPNMFEKYRHDLEQISASIDNYLDVHIELEMHREELEKHKMWVTTKFYSRSNCANISAVR